MSKLFSGTHSDRGWRDRLIVVAGNRVIDGVLIRINPLIGANGIIDQFIEP